MIRLLRSVLILLALPSIAGERVPLVSIEPTAEQAAAPFDPLSMVSACPFGKSWTVMWHVPPQLDVKTGKVITFNLNEPKFNGCLALLIESDPGTAALVTTAMNSIDLTTTPGTVDGDALAASTQAVKNRWESFGVGSAITEVAETGGRGHKVASVLTACEKLEQERGNQK